jgi:Uma2 family endonuclease
VLDPSQIAPDAPRLLKRAEYDRLVDLGMFAGERVELLYGVVVQMSPHGPAHDAAVEELTELLVKALAGRARVRIQSAFAASDGSEPEPDVAVVPKRDHHEAHPTEAWLIVEVAQSSVKKDRVLKAQLYAESGVPEYWIVNVADGLIEVHCDIVGGAYTRVTPYRRGDAVALGRFPDVQIQVADVIH